MKKVYALAAVLTVGLLAWGSQANAQDVDTTVATVTPWEASILAGGVFPREDDMDEGANFQGRLTYDVSPNIAIGGTAGWQSYDFSASTSSGEVEFGDVHGIPLLATVVLKMPLEATENKVVPYFVGGVGTIFWSFNENEGIDADDDNTFAALIGAGIDFYISDRVALFGEAGYLFSDDLETDYTQNSSSGRLNENMDTILLGAGVKARF